METEKGVCEEEGVVLPGDQRQDAAGGVSLKQGWRDVCIPSTLHRVSPVVVEEPVARRRLHTSIRTITHSVGRVSATRWVRGHELLRSVSRPLTISLINPTRRRRRVPPSLQNDRHTDVCPAFEPNLTRHVPRKPAYNAPIWPFIFYFIHWKVAQNKKYIYTEKIYTTWIVTLQQTRTKYSKNVIGCWLYVCVCARRRSREEGWGAEPPNFRNGG